jgi:hypothetical protein
MLGASGAGAQSNGINSVLCRPAMKSAWGALSESGSQETRSYFDGLVAGKYVFNRYLKPQQAAAQLSFGPRFRASYGLLVEEMNDRLRTNGSIHINEVIEYLRKIIEQEDTVSRFASDANYALAGLYLRALEDGVCSFPYE